MDQQTGDDSRRDPTFFPFGWYRHINAEEEDASKDNPEYFWPGRQIWKKMNHDFVSLSSLSFRLLKNSLSEKFSAVDFSAAREDVLPFVDNSRFLDAFDRDIFLSTLEHLQPSEKYTSSA